ncbi:MAG: hypothetical protein O6923_03660 [Actinobacteria bacterium]|nr:hypothetical protein [Actinomycetota bacterium]
MASRTLTFLLVALGMLAAACDSGEAELSTTSSLVTGTTETPSQASTTTTTPEEVTTTTLLRGETVASYEIAVRISTDNGEIFYVVIPSGAYTDVDLENFVGDLLEANPGLWGAEVFENEAAVQAFVIPEDQRTEQQQDLLEESHFVSLIGGDTVKFQGPFAEFGEFVIGS